MPILLISDTQLIYLNFNKKVLYRGKIYLNKNEIILSNEAELMSLMAQVTIRTNEQICKSR